MGSRRHIDGHYYPDFHPAWGGFGEELFYYTSRYYGLAEAFLRNLAERPRFVMSGYKASALSERQRGVMSSILALAPQREVAVDAIEIVETVICKDPGVSPVLLQRYPVPRGGAETADLAGHVARQRATDVSPLESWLAMASRLQMAVAVHDDHVEVDMRVLATHLDSASPVIRGNLQSMIMALHEAGYILRNHPHLTHSEAHRIGDQGAN